MKKIVLLLLSLFLINTVAYPATLIQSGKGSTNSPSIVRPGDHKSLVNSTTTPLGIGATFTGEWQSTIGFAAIQMLVYSDQESASFGLEVEWSSDGSNADDSDVYTIPAANGKPFSFQPAGSYLRIKYTNGSTAQTEFRLETVLKATNIIHSAHRIGDAISDDDDATLGITVIKGKDQNGVYQNVNTTEDGNLTIADNSSGLAISKGDVTGHSLIAKFGNAPDFDTSDGIITVWDGAEDGQAWEQMDYVYSTTANIDSISSSSLSDTVEIVVIGLGEDYVVVTQSATLNGQTRVALSTPLLRVYRAYNNNSTDLVGHVMVYVNTALTAGVPTDTTQIRAIIDPVNQQTEMAVYTVPAGKTGYLTRGYASTSGASKDSNYVIRFYTREEGKVFRLQNINAVSDSGNSIIVLDYFAPLKIPEKTDLEVRVEATAVGATGCAVSAGFDLVLVEN